MSKPSSPAALTQQTFLRGVSILAGNDPDLGHVVNAFGNPPFWIHPPGFPGVVIAILAQQVSLESANAAYAKLEKVIGTISPEGFLSLPDDALRAAGFSRQKASYVRGVARGILSGATRLQDLEVSDDDDARKRLMEVRGIGSWTADTYLLFALRRPDAWPSGDLALVRAIHEIKGLASMPSSEEADAIAGRWRPWRAVAARILWHHYLCTRGRSSSA